MSLKQSWAFKPTLALFYPRWRPMWLHAVVRCTDRSGENLEVIWSSRRKLKKIHEEYCCKRYILRLQIHLANEFMANVAYRPKLTSSELRTHKNTGKSLKKKKKKKKDVNVSALVPWHELRIYETMCLTTGGLFSVQTADLGLWKVLLCFCTHYNSFSKNSFEIYRMLST